MNINDLKLTKALSFLTTDKIGQALQTTVDQKLLQRRRHERKWYENNWFDDGYHFRSISTKTGRIIDHVTGYGGTTERAIPRASRQIRGVGNLLFAAEPFPVVYPERISKEQFEGNEQAYIQALEKAKVQARRQGIWLTTEWEDEQELDIKAINVLLKAAKNSIAYIQVYSDTQKQKLCTEVFDAFDIILDGDKEDIEDCPFVDKSRSRLITEILADPTYQQARLNKLTPDNRYATSEVKQAYMTARYGVKSDDPKAGSIMEHETFSKEVLSENNWQYAVKVGSNTGAMEGKSKGDMIMRHTFWAGGVTLHDEYVDYDMYPFSYYCYEPGALYQKPFIENFIPQNKSTDIIMTRLEKWINAMIVGVYQKRKGETYQVSNFAGGQMIEFEGSPLQQMATSNVGSTPFNVLSMLDKYTEEQGASTAALGQIPNGVKSGVAIEGVKATEYANLKFPTKMLKKFVKKTARLMLERADKDFLEPMEVEYQNDGEPDYFDVIGRRGYELSQKVGKPLPPDITVLDRKRKVRIEIEPGLGFTMQGQREAMKEIKDFLLQFAELGVIPREALTIGIKKFMETYGFGNTQEFMEAIEGSLSQADIDDAQIEKIKLAVIEAMKDAGAVGQEMEDKLIDSTKIGVVEAMKDLGMTDGMGQKQPVQDKVAESLKYADAPPDIRRQIELRAGLTPSSKERISPIQAETMQKLRPKEAPQKPLANR